MITVVSASMSYFVCFGLHGNGVLIFGLKFVVCSLTSSMLWIGLLRKSQWSLLSKSWMLSRIKRKEYYVCKDMYSRIKYIDFLKFIAISGIIVAHSGAPDIIMMIRSFDVPLMVIISAFLAYNSYSKNNSLEINSIKSYIHYYYKRIKRLVLPTWLFLIFYFLIFYFCTGKMENITYYVESFLLTRYGIGYVWIMLIYLYSALFIPVFNKTKFTIYTGIFVAVFYIIYEVCFSLNAGLDNKIIETTFYYIIPYGVLTYLGAGYSFFNDKTKLKIICFSAMIFFACAVYYFFSTGRFQLVSIVKYPPRLYYMSFGISMSFVLMYLCEKNDFSFYSNSFVKYVSQHSMWIYLWHIFILSVYGFINLPEIWVLKFLVVYVFSILMVKIVNLILDQIEKWFELPIIKYLRG